MNISVEDFASKKLKILQDKESFCFGIDAVLLSDFVKIRRMEKTLDLGTGTGVIPLLLASSYADNCFTGLEIQEDAVNLARKSVSLNSLDGRVEIVHGDLKNAPDIFGKNTFDVVTSNPPYIRETHGKSSDSDKVAFARREILCTLSDVVKAAATLLKSDGRFYMIHRPERLAEIIVEFSKKRLEAKRLRFVHPKAGAAPTMLLIEGRKNAKPGLLVEKPLVVYSADGNYTEEVALIYGKQISSI